MPENIDESEYRKRVEEERAKMSVGSDGDKEKDADKAENTNKIAPRAVTGDEDAGADEPEDLAEVVVPEELVVGVEDVKAEIDDKAAQRLAKKEAGSAKKAEAKLRKELKSTYYKRIAQYLNSRANRDGYWIDKDWYEREFWDHKNIEKRQKKLYKKQIQYMWKNSAYMRVRLEGQGILKSGQAKNIADIAKLPFITNADLAKSQREAPPYGYIYSAKPEEISDIGVTNEMSESPRYFFTSQRDLANAYRMVRPIMAAGR